MSFGDTDCFWVRSFRLEFLQRLVSRPHKGGRQLTRLSVFGLALPPRRMASNWPRPVLVRGRFTRQPIREPLGLSPARPTKSGIPSPVRRTELNWWLLPVTTLRVNLPVSMRPRQTREPHGAQVTSPRCIGNPYPLRPMAAY